jgi:alpha-mannosidase
VEGRDLLLTALKRCEVGDRAVVRFYNAGDTCAEAIVQFGLPVDSVHRATAEEIEITELDPVGSSKYCLQTGPSEIVSLLVKFRSVGFLGPAV